MLSSLSQGKGESRSRGVWPLWRLSSGGRLPQNRPCMGEREVLYQEGLGGQLEIIVSSIAVDSAGASHALQEGHPHERRAGHG